MFSFIVLGFLILIVCFLIPVIYCFFQDIKNNNHKLVEVGDSSYFVTGCSMPEKHGLMKVQPLEFWDIRDSHPLFVSSVKYFTVDQGNEVCTLSVTPGENIHIILSALY